MHKVWFILGREANTLHTTQMNVYIEMREMQQAEIFLLFGSSLHAVWRKIVCVRTYCIPKHSLYLHIIRIRDMV